MQDTGAQHLAGGLDFALEHPDADDGCNHAVSQCTILKAGTNQSHKKGSRTLWMNMKRTLPRASKLVLKL